MSDSTVAGDSMGDSSRDLFPFRAFISYCRQPNDLRTAEWLQRSIESYRAPDDLAVPAAVQLIEGRLGKVCRDTTDFRAGPSLNLQIDSRLEQSEWLVVLCSPATPKNEWVSFEIASFLRMRSADHVILVLLEGE